jgi:hypothetical protein
MENSELQVLRQGMWTGVTRIDANTPVFATEPHRRAFAAAGVILALAYNNAVDATTHPLAFKDLVVFQDGKQVVQKRRAEFADKPGACSDRAIHVDGVRPEQHVLALTFTNGATSHACDGKAEPQVHHVVRW